MPNRGPRLIVAVRRLQIDWFHGGEGLGFTISILDGSEVRNMNKMQSGKNRVAKIDYMHSLPQSICIYIYIYILRKD